MTIKEKENALIAAGEKLGELMAKTSEDDKKILLEIKDQVEKYALEMEEKGKCVDRSSLYAVAIILDDNLKLDMQLLEAAKEFVDADYEYIKSLKDAVLEK